MGNIAKFDSIASRYDGPERIAIATIIADTIRTHVVDGKAKSAIDYGCGTGLVGMQMLDDFHSVLFIDASSNMIEQVKQKLEQVSSETVKALCRDLVTEDPSDLHADTIIMAQTLLHIKEVELVLSRLYDVLNDGGHLLIVDFDKNDAIVSDEVHNGFEHAALIDVLKRIGFRHSEAKTFYHGSKMFMNQDASLFILDAKKERG